MPRKVDIRRGKIIPDGAPFLLFGKNGNLANGIEQDFEKSLRDTLGIQNPEKIVCCKSEIQFLINLYLERNIQDKGILKSERNKALESILKTSDNNFVSALREINYEAEAALLDAIDQCPDKSWRSEFLVETSFELMNKIKNEVQNLNIKKAKAFIQNSIINSLPELKKEKGPKSNLNLALLIEDLTKVYVKLTGQKPTYYIHFGNSEERDTQSKFITFAEEVFRLLSNHSEKLNSQSTIKNQVRKAVERMNEKGSKK